MVQDKKDETKKERKLVIEQAMRFWAAQLNNQQWLMDGATRLLIRNTIEYLKELIKEKYGN